MSVSLGLAVDLRLKPAPAMSTSVFAEISLILIAWENSNDYW